MRFLITSVALLASTSVVAQDDTKIGGFRVEAHAGIERPNLNDKRDGDQYVAKLSSSFAYGAEIGYDVAVSKKVTVGPYVSYDRGNSDKCESGSLQPTINYTVCFKAKSNVSAGLRTAFVAGKKGEIYLGLGYDKYKYTYSEVLRQTPTNTVLSTYSNSKGNSGIGVSFGYNHKLSKNVYAGVGFKVSELGDFENSDWSLQRTQGPINLGARF